jgi:dihydrofolate reductase
MKVSMISAMDRNRVIGTREGGIPWRLPRDTQHFRAYTAGKHMLVGRKTLEEMSGWFTDQTPVVLTHSRDYQTETGRVAHSVEEAVTEAFEDGATELVVSGGASVYAAALPYADELVLTMVDTEAEVEEEKAICFPDYADEIEWETVLEEHYPPDDENEFPMTFVTLRRIAPSSLRPGRLHLM